jgi:hypothetical protein
VANIASGETYSIVSDYLRQGTGYYKLYLPAGTYTLHANSINPEFNGGSGIGPYASTIYDLSFVAPNPIAPVTYQGDSVGSDELITISVSQTTTINFNISGSGSAILPTSNTEDESFSDLFGSTSHLTTLLLLAVIMLLRQRGTTRTSLR